MRLIVFLSYKGTLDAWQAAGILERELASYRRLKPHFEEIYFFSYAKETEAGGFKILANYLNLPIPVYILLSPFLHWRKLRQTDIFKTNQMSAAPAALWCKLFFPQAKLVMRQGFQWSKFSPRPIVKFIEKLAYRFADAVIVTSQSDKDYIRKFVKDSLLVGVIPNFVDADLFRPHPEIRKEPNLIISIGRLESQKNYLNLIGALAGTNWSLEIFGKGSLEKKFKEEAEKIGVILRLRGIVPNKNLSQELARAQIFVLPSLYEGHPKTLIEAMACGLPVVASDIPNHREIIKDGETGILSRADADSLRMAIGGLISNEERKRELGEAARRLAKDSFALESVAAEELDFYQKILPV